MQEIKTDIIPVFPQFAKVIGERHELNKEAICIFTAIGFFLDTDSYWKDRMVLPPASICILDDEGFFQSSKSWFEWYYQPENISFTDSVDQFSTTFEEIIQQQTADQRVILPLSGGLDSRTQAAALMSHSGRVNAYSYSFQGGYPESKISKKIAKVCGYDFTDLSVPPGYLWGVIDDLALINECYSDFTHPRQMAFLKDYEKMGDIFSLGHWGDVLFDGTDVVDEKNLREILLKKIVKKGGIELGESLWNSWNLEGTFTDYFYSRIDQLLDRINIDNPSAKIRAFKSKYWAPRWTSINLSVFAKVKPITLPYYDERMCRFICAVPEKYLNKRQIQIEYIKRKSAELAKITWQDVKPFNLFNHRLNKVPYHLPYRILSKLKREMNNSFGRPFVQRNWELQFLGADNDKELKDRLFDAGLQEMVDESIIEEYYNKFNNVDPVYYSHPLSMLLTLSMFNKHYLK